MVGGSYARQVVDVLTQRTSLQSARLPNVAPRALQRHQEVVNSAWSARLCWLALHSAAIGVLFFVDSDLSRAWRSSNYRFLGAYLTVLLATVLSYFYVCGSSPGYVDEVMREVRSWGPPEGPQESPQRSVRSGVNRAGRDPRTPTRHASLLDLKEAPGEYDPERAGFLSPLSAKRLQEGATIDKQGTQLREPRRPAHDDTVTELLCQGVCANSHADSPTLETRPSDLAVRTPALKPPREVAVTLPEESPNSVATGGSDLGERSPLLMSKSRSLGRLEDSGGSRSSTPKSPSLSRYNSGKRCTYCQVWQPLRTKHCHECDRCVLRFDHHCFWVGTCVGYRNHRRFWWYLFFESCLGLWTVAINMSAFDWDDQTEGWFSLNVLMILDTVTLVCFLLFLIALLVFHGYLAATDQTTYETTRRKRIAYLRPIPDNISPFSKGCAANLRNFCCGSTSHVPVYEIPSLDELRARALTSSWLENEYYSCC